MIAALVIAAAAAAAQPSGPSPADSPLREVVYHVSYARHERLSEGSYGGGIDPRPAVQGADQSDQGTVTIDVMAVASDTLGVRVRESWNQRPRPATFLGNVAPDGALHFGDQPLSEASTILLPAFGPNWMHDEPIDVGAKWTVHYTGTDADVTTDYKVVSADGDTVTIRENQTVDVRSVRGLDANTSGTITYKAGLLVPIAIELERRSSRVDVDEVDYETMDINIDRVSDSLDPAK